LASLCAQYVVVVVLELRVREMVPTATPPQRTPNQPNSDEIASEKNTYVLASPYNNAGALATCFPSLHRLHLNVSCVSQSVSSLNWKSCLSASTEKWRSVSSISSTTAEESACFEAWRWKIFSSIVPVEMKRYTKPAKSQESKGAE
jgi:hypothetical protein